MVKRILPLLFATCLAAEAADNVPTEASIRELLEITNVQKLLEQMIPQLDNMMQKTMAEALKGQTIPPDAQQMVDRSRADALATMKEELAWSKLEPMYIRIYQKSLTQEEVTGIIGLYKTPAGQAMINKMPLVIQNTMSEMQQMMAPMIQRMQQSQQKLAAEILAKSKTKTKS